MDTVWGASLRLHQGYAEGRALGCRPEPPTPSRPSGDDPSRVEQEERSNALNFEVKIANCEALLLK